MCKTSESIKEIAKALSQFQHEAGKIVKDSTNPFFKSKYATLTNIQDAIREPLYSSGLTYTQHPCGENELTTILMHTSGEYIMSSYKMTPAKNDPQSLGSAITYQRRYALGAILGLNIDDDDDDDGNGASGLQQPKTQSQSPSQGTNNQPVNEHKAPDKKEFKVITSANLDDMITRESLCWWLYQAECTHGKGFDYLAYVERFYTMIEPLKEQFKTIYEEYKAAKNTKK